MDVSENIEYLDAKSASKYLDGGVFRYCTFSTFEIAGQHICAVFIGCTFQDLDWYWGLFNSCLFVESEFHSSVFRGTLFPNTKFVDCEFAYCRFVKDNLNGDCSAEQAKWYGCTFQECEGIDALIQSSAP